jgi:nitroimidazol reductase NimA-like FMN-containing flavoprotein (pyridoxamine 5'-phosphate oxidase superfamily)
MVCVEVDEVVTDDRWRSVIATGHYEELPKTSGSNGARPRAQEYSRQIVEARPAWPADSCQRQCDDEECDAERELAYQVLKTQPMWWQTSWAAFSARADRDPAEPYLPVYYRIRIDRVTGHEATRDARDAISYAVPSSSGRWGWLRKTLTRVFGDRSKEAGSAS